MTRVSPRLMSACTVLAIAGATSLPARAEEPAGWNWEAELYFWGADIGGTTGNGEDVDVSLSDILDNLELAIMGTVWARTGDWTLFYDGVYLDVNPSASTTANVGPIAVDAEADLDLATWISTFGAGYKVYDDGATSLNAVAGLRALHVDTELEIAIGPRDVSIDQSETNWDGIVGLAGQTDINENWYLFYYGDIGSGDSNLTWQVRVGASYRFNNWDLTVGYRHLDFDLSDNIASLDDLDVSGPFVGARFRF